MIFWVMILFEVLCVCACGRNFSSAIKMEWLLCWRQRQCC